MIKWNNINEVEPEENRNVLIKFSKTYFDSNSKYCNMPSCYVVYKNTSGEYVEACGEEYTYWDKEEISHWVYLEDLED